jgi:hypothetical protein
MLKTLMDDMEGSLEQMDDGRNLEGEGSQDMVEGLSRSPRE